MCGTDNESKSISSCAESFITTVNASRDEAARTTRNKSAHHPPENACVHFTSNQNLRSLLHPSITSINSFLSERAQLTLSPKYEEKVCPAKKSVRTYLTPNQNLYSRQSFVSRPVAPPAEPSICAQRHRSAGPFIYIHHGGASRRPATQCLYRTLAITCHLLVDKRDRVHGGK